MFCGCDDSPKTSLLANSDFLFYGEISEEHSFYTPSLEEFDQLYNSNLNYIIYFSDEGCSACQQFNPIMKEYVEKNHSFVVQVAGEDKYKIEEKYKDTFFPETGILTPSVFVKEKGTNFYTVNYKSYMQTYRVFSKHMNSRYETSKCAYFCGEISGKTPIISNFSMINFTSNEAFKNTISNRLLSTQKNVFLKANSIINSMTLFEKNSDNKFDIIDSNKISENLSEEIIQKYI